MNERDETFLRQALQAARRGIEAGQTPFGAVIVRGQEVLADEHNAVWRTTDPTAHAEVQAIRAACERLGTIDLSGCEIYSSCEPCPMCFSAIHWAKLDRVIFSARIEDARRAGFSELEISNEQMRELGRSGVQIVAGLLRREGAALFKEFKASGGADTY
jgi:tRNA(Arg) A34 adenosine deaminase TadA